ncbi:hypothetical protein B0I35DRAFT_440136 [Stachybotrys elegans]|uniref:Uncharacterized protein n=1 Tax=Stachybotrys elegans TaxID=80388 RepID=A0A8K0SGR9_9HYPO|nr:hypothetical protein B0I35DRAFT_440136 [Stachybotrys elegans]
MFPLVRGQLTPSLVLASPTMTSDFRVLARLALDESSSALIRKAPPVLPGQSCRAKDLFPRAGCLENPLSHYAIPACLEDEARASPARLAQCFREAHGAFIIR